MSLDPCSFLTFRCDRLTVVLKRHERKVIRPRIPCCINTFFSHRFQFLLSGTIERSEYMGDGLSVRAGQQISSAALFSEQWARRALVEVEREVVNTCLASLVIDGFRDNCHLLEFSSLPCSWLELDPESSKCL